MAKEKIRNYAIKAQSHQVSQREFRLNSIYAYGELVRYIRKLLE
jgi:hypothetical protein